MERPQLAVPVDAVTNALRREDQPVGVELWTLASEQAGTVAFYRLYSQDVPSYRLTGIDESVLSAINARAFDGADHVTVNEILLQMGYSSPTSPTGSSARTEVGNAIKRLSRIEIEMSEVKGRPHGSRDPEKWLTYLPPTPLLSCSIQEDNCGHVVAGSLRPNLPGDPVTALPLLMRAKEAGQLISIRRDMLPTGRMSMSMRAMALRIAVRQLQGLSNKRLLVDDLFIYAGYSFAHSDAGRSARYRAVRSLERLLESMSVQNTVIGGWEPVFEGRRLRAIDLLPPRAPPTILPLSTANNTEFQDDLSGETRISA